jgi:hypothetical protein
MNGLYGVGINDGFNKMLPFIAKSFLGCLIITIRFIYLLNSLTKTNVVFFIYKKCWNLSNVKQFAIMMHGSEKRIIISIRVSKQN